MSRDSLSVDVEDEAIRRGCGISHFNYDLQTVKVHELADAVTILNTKAVGLANITTPIPHPTDRSLKNRATLGPVEELTAEEIEERHTRLESTLATLEEIDTQLNSDNPPEQKALDFPNLAWEAVKAGLAKEKITNDQLNKHIETVSKHQKDIDLLLDLSVALNGLKDDTKELPQDIRQRLTELKERGVDLWKSEDMSVDKEKISKLNSASSSKVDNLRSAIQIEFTTKIQVMIQAIGAIMETIKDMVKNDAKLKEKANSAVRGG